MFIKRNISVLFIIFSFSCLSQNFNTIPDIDISELGDNWYKFVTKEASFDVEIYKGKLKKGIITWFDGSIYSGNFKNNQLSGRGTYTWPNGIKYQGSFKNNMRHGRGSLILQNNTKWSGKWSSNKKNGKGKIFDENNNVIKEGVWEMDVLISEKI